MAPGARSRSFRTWSWLSGQEGCTRRRSKLRRGWGTRYRRSWERKASVRGQGGRKSGCTGQDGKQEDQTRHNRANGKHINGGGAKNLALELLLEAEGLD